MTTAKSTQGEWDFSDIPPAKPPVVAPEPSPAKVLTVSELTLRVRTLLEKELGEVSITGEITNMRLQPSGHVYFSLKDETAQLSCVMFRLEARSVPREWLKDGQKIIAHGEITVYEARGQYQLRVLRIEQQGLGALQARFEQLKRKLQEQGYFAPERKRPLPRYPFRIGLVTSPSGAAIRDIIHVIRRRDPGVRIVISSCRVQGEGASDEVACAIALLNEWSETSPLNRVDIILVARGGGSLEDLWAFNEEAVARAIFNSMIPVISGVGHEIDFTICDFVADFRAATPSAAAEIVTEGVFSARGFVAEIASQMQRCARRQLSNRTEGLEALDHRLQRCHPLRRLREYAQRLDEGQQSLARCFRAGLRNAQKQWLALQQRFQRLRPSRALELRRELVDQLQREVHRLVLLRLESARQRLESAHSRLRLLSPLNVLDRGYSITLDHSGAVLRDPKAIQPGQLLITQLQKGKLRSIAQGAEEA